MTDSTTNSMTVAHGLAAIPASLRGGVVVIGNFDGVHRGHQALLRLAMADADARGVHSVVLTFEPHPRTFFRPDAPVFRLTPAPAKERVIQAVGIEGLVVLDFDRDLAAMPAEAFVEHVLVERLGAASVVVGHDLRFGKGRAGDGRTLAASGDRLGFATLAVAAVAEPDGEVISSSAIREALAAGDIQTANRLLGYRWFVIGEVIHGDRRGRELGFPTANIALSPNSRLRHGIYAVRFAVDGRVFDGVASYGRRPTFGDGAPLLEVFLFDFAGDLYGKTVVVTFCGWLRPELKFDSVEELVRAMNQDVTDARRMLASAGPGTALDAALSPLGPGPAVVEGVGLV